MHPASRLLLTTALLVSVPGLVSAAFAHGGAYRGPPGEVPPDSREPTDPPPPDEGGGPTTPEGEPGGGVGTPGGGTGSPSTGGGTNGGGPSSGSGPTSGGGPGGGPTSGIGRGPGAAKGPGYAGWVFWWNFNKDELLGLRGRLHRDVATGQAVKAFSRRAADQNHVSVTRAAVTERVLPALRDLLERDDLNFDIQSAAALAAAKAGDQSIVPTLQRMVRNESGRYHRVVEESAALALGVLGNPSDDVVEFLVETLGDREHDASFVRPFAAISLGLLGGDADGRSREALLDVLARREVKPDVKPAALVALGLLEDDRSVAPLLHALTEQRLPAKRAERLESAEMPFVVAALGRVGAPGVTADDTSVVDALQGLLVGRGRARGTPNVRRSAAIALGQIAPQCGDRDRRDVLKVLRTVAKNEKDDSVRNFAIIALGRVAGADDVDGDERARVVQTLAHYLDKGRPAYLTQPFAALALGLVARGDVDAGRSPQEEHVRKPLREKFQSWRGDPKARGAYAIASGLATDALAVPPLTDALQDRGLDKGLRGQAAIAVGMIGDSSARTAVRAVVRDETDRALRVRTAVSAGLLGDAHAVAELVEILRSGEESQYVLGSVALALGQIGDERAVDPLLEIVLDEDSRFPDITRALATVALGQIAERRDVPALASVTRDINFRALGVSPALTELVTIL